MIVATTALAISVLLGVQTDKPVSYVDTQKKWRADYEKSLLEPEGWLSVAGLFWLKPGSNAVGSDPDSVVVLPRYASPFQAGVFNLNGDKVTLSVVPGVDLRVNGKGLTDAPLQSDLTGHPDQMSIGGVTFHVIQRADKVGIRLYDPKSHNRTSYRGLHWYPIDEKWVVPATFVPYNPPKTAQIANVLGQITPVPIPGYLSFKIKGQDCRLDCQDEPGGWFLDFKDGTTNKTTYGAGRFLDVMKPKDGPLVIDFNQTTNPPCGYTSFATCPLPPRGNELAVEIKAGEKKYHN